MKQTYITPVSEVIDLDVNTAMMAESAPTGVGGTPSEPDAPNHRGKWGDLWN
jgi:hypothetical protein